MPIVEGFAEVESVPVLLRRLNPAVVVGRPFRVKRNRVVHPGELERAITQLLRSREGVTAIILLLDADDDPACTLAPALLARAIVATHLPVSVVFAVREFEAWFLAGLESLRGTHGIAEDAAYAGDPEVPRGAKGKFETYLGRRYLDVDDQVRFVKHIDLGVVRGRSPSFDKFVRDIARIWP